MADAELRALGSEIYELKQQGAPEEEIEARVANLDAKKVFHAPAVLELLKLQASELDQSTEHKQISAEMKRLVQLLPKDEAKKWQKRRKKIEAEAKAAAKLVSLRRADGKLWADVLLTQRKIPHLLASEGRGNTFRYHRGTLSDACGFVHGEAVVLTEKWDGTTMQATRDGYFKRVDCFKKGDPKKHGASEKERYRLEKLDMLAKENNQMAKCVAPYTKIFGALPEGLCLYFEACGPKINARFKHLDVHPLRVFDAATYKHTENGGGAEWLPFLQTLKMCKELGLPVVHHLRVPRLDVQAICDSLLSPLSLQYHDVEAKLEGYVVRNDETETEERGRACIAKIRVEDMSKLVDLPQRIDANANFALMACDEMSTALGFLFSAPAPTRGSL